MSASNERGKCSRVGVELYSIYIDKNLPAESNPISFDHLLRLLKDNANPDTFLSQLYFTADRFLKRLTSKQSTDHEMLHNTILAIHRMERAAQSANKWAFLKLIEDQMSAFVCVTIARLHTTTGIPDDTYSLMQECSCVKQNAAYRKMVELHEGKMFNERCFIDVAKIKPIAPVTDSDRTLARLSPLRYKYIATMRRRQGGEINATYVLPFSHLYWLIADHKTNKTFAEKLTLYSDEFLLRLRDKNLDSTMDNAHVRNLAIALWRVENSSRYDWWEENIKACLDNFVRYQLTKLILDGTLENETINLLLNVELLNQHEQLRKLLGLEAFVQSESEQDSDEEEETVVVQRPPHSIPLKKSFPDVFPDFRTNSGQLRHTFDRYYGKEDKATGTLKPIWDVLWTTVAFEETVKYVKDNCITTKDFIPDLIIDQCLKKGDVAEAVYWTKYYGLPKNKQPSDIQKNWNTERVVRPEHVPGFYELKEGIEIIEVATNEQVKEMIAHFETKERIAIDVESAIYTEPKRAALFQLASDQRVYLVDALFHEITDECLAQLAKSIFNNEKITKIVFDQGNDVKDLHSFMPTLDMTHTKYLYMEKLWQKAKRKKKVTADRQHV